MAQKKRRVLLTRQNNASVAEILAKNAVETVQLPLIEVDFTANPQDVDDVMDELGSYNWITFTSANGVRGFFGEFFKKFEDIRSIGLARIACVGKATAREVAKYRLKPDIVSEISAAEALADEMGNFETLENLKILCVEGNMARGELLKKLGNEYNAIVDTVEVYRTKFVKLQKDNPAVLEFKARGADIVVFSSPSAVESFCKNADILALESGAVRPKIVTIGPTTTKAVEEKGMKVARESVEPTPEAVAAAVMALL